MLKVRQKLCMHCIALQFLGKINIRNVQFKESTKTWNEVCRQDYESHRNELTKKILNWWRHRNSESFKSTKGSTDVAWRLLNFLLTRNPRNKFLEQIVAENYLLTGKALPKGINSFLLDAVNYIIFEHTELPQSSEKLHFDIFLIIFETL